jgi:hypothetical protein
MSNRYTRHAVSMAASKAQPTPECPNRDAGEGRLLAGDRQPAALIEVIQRCTNYYAWRSAPPPFSVMMKSVRQARCTERRHAGCLMGQPGIRLP